LAHEAADATEANDATSNEADVADMPSEAVEAEAYEANNDEADEADEAIEDVEKVRSLLVNGIAIVLCLVFSLTKYSVIFTEVEGDFEKITINLELSRSLGRSKFGANCAPSECDATINLKEKLPFITAMIAERSKPRSIKRLGVSTINSDVSLCEAA